MAGGGKTSSMRRPLIALGAVVAVLAAGICILMFLPERETVAEPTVAPPVDYLRDMLEINSEITAVTIAPQSGSRYTISIDMEKQEFILEADDLIFPGSMERMDEQLYGAISVTRLVRVAENADDAQLALFGLDAPVVTWQIHFDGGRTESFELGAGLPTGNGSYAKLTDSREVFIYGAEQSAYLLRPLEEIYDISYTVLPPSTEDLPTWMYITGITLNIPGRDTLEINKRSDGELIEMPLGSSAFRMMQPFETDCNDYLIQTIFMEAVTYIQPEEVVAVRPADLSAYGLDNPATLTAVIPLSEEEELIAVLQIGNFDSSLGGRYVMIEGHDAVLLDRSGNYGFLDADPQQLIKRLVWLHMINTVSSVVFDLDGVVRVLEMTHEDDSLRGYLDGEELSEDNTRRLYTSALNITATAGTDAPVPDVPAAYSITMYFTGGGSETIELMPLSDSQFLIVYDGVSAGAYITRQSLFQNLLNRFDILDAGGNLNR